MALYVTKIYPVILYIPDGIFYQCARCALLMKFKCKYCLQEAKIYMLIVNNAPPMKEKQLEMACDLKTGHLSWINWTNTVSTC